MSEHRVGELDAFEFVNAAEHAARVLKGEGVEGYTGVMIRLCPGDATRYDILIGRFAPQRRGDTAETYWMGTSFGKVYPFDPANGEFHWDYVASHWNLGNEHTARVITRFLNTLAPLLMEDHGAD